MTVKQIKRRRVPATKRKPKRIVGVQISQRRLRALEEMEEWNREDDQLTEALHHNGWGND